MRLTPPRMINFNDISILDVVSNLLINILSLLSFFSGLGSLNLRHLFLMISLVNSSHFLLIFFFLLLNQFLHFISILLSLIILGLDEHLGAVGGGGAWVSATSFLAELDWILVFGNVFGVIIMIKMAMQLHILITALIFFLSVDSFHLIINFLLVADDKVGLVLEVGSPLLWSSITDLNKFEVALIVWHGSGSISLIGVWNVIRVVVVVGDLDHFVIIVSSSSVFLHVIALVVFVEEAIIVAVWSKFGIVQFLVVITNSLHVLWGVSDLWIMWREIVGVSESDGAMNSLIKIIELVPFSSSFLWIVVWVIISHSKILSKPLSSSLLGQAKSILASIDLDIGAGLEEDGIIWNIILLNEILLLLFSSILNSNRANLSKKCHYGERNSFHVLLL